MLQLEKEKLVEYFESTFSHIKEEFQSNYEIDINNPKNRKEILDLILKIKTIKEEDIQFYNSLLAEIPHLDYFSEQIEDLNQAKLFLSESLTSKNKKTNSKNFAILMKSSKIYYFINKKTTKNLTDQQLIELGDLGLIKDYLQAIWPSAKQEELLGILLYINSGKATEDYLNYLKNPENIPKEKYLYSKFKNSLKDLHVELDEFGSAFVEISNRKSTNISSSNKMDAGVILDEKNKKLYVGFATSKYDTSDQKKQYFEKLKALKDVVNHEDHILFKYEIISAYITNSLLNENELKEGDREHKKDFLSHFSSSLTKEEKNKINCLSFLAIAGNIKMPDVNKGLDIKDFFMVNPYVSGADTLWIYNKFEEIKKIKSEEKQYYELRMFLTSEVEKILEIFDKKLPDFQFTHLNNQFGEIFKNLEKMLKSTLELFHEGNMKKEAIYHEEYINSVVKIGNLYKKIHKNKFNMAMPEDSSEIQGNIFYNSLKNRNSLINILDNNNEDYISIVKDQEEYRSNRNTKVENFKKNVKEDIVELKAFFLNNNINLFKNEQNISSSLEQIICLSQLYPSRPIRKVLSSVSTDAKNFSQIKNFMQNYHYWERNKDESEKNKEKYLISEILLNNCHDILQLKKELMIFSNQENKSEKLIHFKALAGETNKKRIYKKLKNKWKKDEKSFNNEVNRFKKEFFNPSRLCSLTRKDKENRLMAYLQIKAENVSEKNRNLLSVNSFNELYQFALNHGLGDKNEIKNYYNLVYGENNIAKMNKV